MLNDEGTEEEAHVIGVRGGADVDKVNFARPQTRVCVCVQWLHDEGARPWGNENMSGA